jgi:hypothetical protein
MAEAMPELLGGRARQVEANGSPGLSDRCRRKERGGRRLLLAARACFTAIEKRGKSLTADRRRKRSAAATTLERGGSANGNVVNIGPTAYDVPRRDIVADPTLASARMRATARP